MARLILTRPQEQADAWLLSFKEAGYDIVSWPLISIQSIKDSTRVVQLWKEWSSYQSVMFVSRSAVDHAMMLKPQLHNWGQTRCWATGPGTTRALLSHGAPIQLIDAPDERELQFDTESLWKIVHTKINLKQPVLIVRGVDLEHDSLQSQGVGREWLSQQIKA
ncbi:MAG: uroporphyrinogen-III synthase, partial [Limnohabitans sp.]|nr:uroporphyrinogen-III synthase [Limnohabitans sp.]